MNKEELEKDYYADRPTEPYSDDDSPNDWANIAHYAEENLEKAFKRIAELEAQIEKMKSQYDYAFNQLRESREIICLMLSQYKNKKEIDYSTKKRGEKLLNQGVYKND